MEQLRFPSANKRPRTLRFISCLAFLGVMSTLASAQSPSEISTCSQYTESILVPASGAPVFVENSLRELLSQRMSILNSREQGSQRE